MNPISTQLNSNSQQHLRDCKQFDSVKRINYFSFYSGWVKYFTASVLLLIVTPTKAIAALAPNSLPNSTPSPPENLSSCQNLAFGSFVPDRSPYTTVNGIDRYSIDTVWTASASNGTTATLSTVQVNNNSGNFITTGNNANVYFTDFADPNSDTDTDPNNDFVSPKLNVANGVPADGDSWDVQLVYSQPIGNARVLLGDVDSQRLFFKDVAISEGFLGNVSVAPSNAYQGTDLMQSFQGNVTLFKIKERLDLTLARMPAVTAR